MFQNLSNTQKGIAFALIGYTSFSFADLCIKWLSNLYPIFQITAMNGVFGLLTCVCLMPLLGVPRDMLNKTHLPYHLARGVLNVGISFSVVFSLNKLPVADVYSILFTIPFIAALMGWLFFKEKITVMRMAVITCGFIGVVIAMQPGIQGFALFQFVPLFCAFLIAGMFILSKPIKSADTLTLAIFPFTATASVIFYVLHDGFVMPELSHWFLFALTGVLAVSGMLCVSKAFIHADAAAVSPFVYTQMVWAILFGYLIFGDVPTLWMMIGAGVIITSGIILIMIEKNEVTPLKSTPHGSQ